MFTHRPAVLAVLLAALGCAPNRVVVLADDEVPLAAPLEAGMDSDYTGPERGDPPTRVVRLNYAEGPVSRQPAGLDDWAPALVNLPLAAGDSLWVGPGGIAELHAGATDLRLAQGSGLDVLRLDSRALQLGLPRGTMELRLPPGWDMDSVEVDTPTGAVLLDHPGIYRVDVDPGGAADQVTVRSGQAEVTAAGTTVPVNPGNTLDLSGGDQPSYDVGEARTPDGFDRWCAVRERREDASESAIYVGRDMTGYEDLDGHGDWRMDKTYGTVWAPRVAADWAPYRDGRWAWSEPYGWTWVDAAPWGFAPSHYGRWAQADHAWVWVPHAEGMRMSKPVYAPALVAFVGGPGLHGAAPAGAGVAWFPLGPREPYLPAYVASRAYVQALNAGSLAPGASAFNASAGHVNQGIQGAVTVVPQSVFLGSGPVAAAALAVHGPALAQGLRVGSAPALVPRRESVLAALPGAAPASRPPVSFQARPLMVRDRLPLAAVPFEARQQALAAGRGRPLAAPAVNGLRQRDPAARAIPARLATAPGSGGNMRPARPGPGASPSMEPRPFAAPSSAPFRPGMAIQSLSPPPQAGQPRPVNPGQQGRPGNPGQQGRPMNPGQQGRPMNPGQQGRPMNPGQQGRPVNPGQQGNRPPGAGPQGEPNRPQVQRRAAPARRGKGGGQGQSKRKSP
jgi:hypothetical protein